jgi:putative transposase
MIQRKAYKYKLKKKNDFSRFALFCGHCRFVWNKALALQKQRLEAGMPVLSYGDLALLLRLWKASEEYGFLKEAHSQALQQTLKALDRALWDGLKKQKGFPRLKKKGLHDSFRFPQGFALDGNRIYLPKLGWFQFHNSREIEGTPKNVTVSRRGPDWFVSVQVELEVPDPVHASESTIGIDMGIANFATCSDGTIIEPLNSFRGMEKKLAREQRKLSRKDKGSCNWYKQKARVSKVHIRIADARNDFLHKASTTINKNHAVVVLEDLRVKNMSASAKGTLEDPGRNIRAKSGLNKSILDQGWYEFRRQLEYKQSWRGGYVIFVSPRNTSRTCPRCDHMEAANRKSQADFACLNCGFKEQADYVAALNILAAGQAVTACGEAALVASLKQEPAETGFPVLHLAVNA